MTDRPIIFSAPMVRALLAGRKTQTRRLYKVPAGSYVEQGRVWAMTDGCAYGDAALPYAPGDRIIPCIGIQAHRDFWAMNARKQDDHGQPIYDADGVLIRRIEWPRNGGR